MQLSGIVKRRVDNTLHTLHILQQDVHWGWAKRAGGGGTTYKCFLPFAFAVKCTARCDKKREESFLDYCDAKRKIKVSNNCAPPLGDGCNRAEAQQSEREGNTARGENDRERERESGGEPDRVCTRRYSQFQCLSSASSVPNAFDSHTKFWSHCTLP